MNNTNLGNVMKKNRRVISSDKARLLRLLRTIFEKELPDILSIFPFDREINSLLLRKLMTIGINGIIENNEEIEINNSLKERDESFTIIIFYFIDNFRSYSVVDNDLNSVNTYIIPSNEINDLERDLISILSKLSDSMELGKLPEIYNDKAKMFAYSYLINCTHLIKDLDIEEFYEKEADSVVKSKFSKILSPYKDTYKKYKTRFTGENKIYMQNLSIGNGTINEIYHRVISNSFTILTILAFKYCDIPEDNDKILENCRRNLLDNLIKINNNNYTSLLVSEQGFINQVSYYISNNQKIFKLSGDQIKSTLDDVFREATVLKEKLLSEQNNFFNEEKYNKLPQGDISIGFEEASKLIDENSGKWSKYRLPSNNVNKIDRVCNVRYV
jgi:hypothetical protein